ncbi:MAG: hypothetical protein C0592_06540 [Marinilabiliales bacterium]|nr:MAG: hypothetical protein C0592_06540 [Marinilabiliales bacterium]
MRIFILLLGGILLSSVASAQMSTNATDNTPGIECIIGVITENPDDFYKIVNLLEYTDGIIVHSYCSQDKLINLNFEPLKFKEEADIFDLITSYYVDAQCFRMTMSKELYYKQCKSEVNKQNSYSGTDF